LGFGLGLDLGVDLREGARALEARAALVEERVVEHLPELGLRAEDVRVHRAPARVLRGGVSVRACVRVCVRVSVRACVRVCERACVSVCA